METEETSLNEKNEKIFMCLKCDFKCCYLSDWNRHLSTRKHQIGNNGNQMEINYECDCGKLFITNSGLWKHKKKCLTEKIQYIDGININDKNALVIHLLKQNTDLQHKIIDMSSKSTITNNTNNTTNNTFNLNVFLNEKLKRRLRRFHLTGSLNYFIQ